MGMMGMFKWLRKDITQRERNGWNLAQKQCGLNNESYRNALQAFIDRRRFAEDIALETDSPSSPDKKRADIFAKNNNNNKCDNERKQQDTKSIIPGVPHIRASEIFEIGWVAGTEDRYLELIFAEWQNTRVSLKRHTHPECKDAVKADLDVLSEIRHPNILLLMATTQTDDHGLVSVFESVDCTLYNYMHEQGERISIQGIAKCGGKLSDALRHSHMRGYIHGAITSHCVYLASSGVIKLGGWELAININNPKPDREYEQRLRTEIFKWQAPELFYGYSPSKESDVYGLTLLIWELCTMQVPWSGCSKADVERQYVYWKRGVIMDLLYDFPPLLNNLLEAGLQLDVAKRTLDMNRMRRFLQTLEMQYEDADPVFVHQYANNNNETAKTYVVPKVKSPTSAPKSKRLIKSASAKQLSYAEKNPESPSKRYLYMKKVIPKKNTGSKIAGHVEQINFFDAAENVKRTAKEDLRKNTNILCNVQNNHKMINNLEDSDSIHNEDNNTCSSLQPWNSTYRKVRVPKEMESRSISTSAYSDSTQQIESTDDESYKDARTNLRHLKEAIATKREQFFSGSESPNKSLDASPRTKNKIFTQARSKDYEPHKPASHKTSLEPRCSKSPGLYDPTYMKSSFQQCRRVPYSHTPDCIKDAIMQPQVLNSDTQSFFETSLWRKEKLICISKMRKSCEDEQSQFLFAAEPVDGDTVNTTCTHNLFRETPSPKSDNTYFITSKPKANETETSQEQSTRISRNECDTLDNTQRISLQVLRDALDRATEIVRSVTPNTDESCSSPPFKTYANFEVTVNETQDSKSVFEDMYNLKSSTEHEEIQSIERSTNGNETFLFSSNTLSSANNNDITKEDEHDITVTSYENSSHFQCGATFTRNFVCESIAEVSSEFNSSCNDSKTEKNVEHQDNNDTTTEEINKPVKLMKKAAVRNEHSDIENQSESNVSEKKSAVTNLTLMLLNDVAKHKNCKSCNDSNLPRRRSLPAALSQLRALNNSALGKLPIRRGDMPDSTVEDIYIDDEFGGSLNVNMVLLDEDLSFDEDFLPEISEL